MLDGDPWENEFPSVNKFSIELFDDFHDFDEFFTSNENLVSSSNQNPKSHERFAMKPNPQNLDLGQYHMENDEFSFFDQENLDAYHQFEFASSPCPPSVRNRSTSQLVPISALGSQNFQKIFNFSHFNRMQSACFADIFKSNQNVVLSAPTGAGKTGIMELAILRLVSLVGASNAKVIYIAPTRALCDERQRDWESRFRAIGLNCKSLTGDTPFSQVQMAQQAQIIVTTPEKWDSITRHWNDTRHLIDLVRLILIDEIHTIKDGVRGACLEAIITRMKSIKSISGSTTLRIVAVSATVPNLQDFANWLIDVETKKPALMKQFGHEYRPVRLKTVVYGYPNNGNYFKFDDSLKYRLLDILSNHSMGKPSLIFCTTRKSVIDTAEYLSLEINSTEPYVTVGTRRLLQSAANRLVDKKLGQLVTLGVAYHHGGLNPNDRREIESLFSQSILLVICSTSTLAVGVNLPAHLVIIKGTQFYDYTNTKKAIDCSDMDILQMIGRAGRPQYDTSGTAVIMTTFDRKSHYENMGKEVIESCLHESLMEHLNTEISLGCIKNHQEAILWLHSTFLYVRIQRNPSYYRLKNCGAEEATLSSEKRLEAIFLKDLAELETGQLAVRDASKGTILSTEYGDITTRHFLRFQTAQLFIKLKPHATQRDVLEALSKSEEFAEIRFHSDKALLNAINKDQGIRFPISGKIAEVYQKVFLLIQATIAGINVEKDQKSKSHSLAFDAMAIMKNANRIIKGMVAIFMAKQEYRSIISALKLSQGIKCQLWDNSNLKTRQIDGVGPVIAKAFAKAGIDSFAKLCSYDVSRLNMIAGRNPPFGTRIVEAASKFPQLTMSLLHVQPVTASSASNPKKNMNVEITVKIGLQNAGNVLKSMKNSPIVYCFVAGTSLGNLIETRRFPVSKLTLDQVFTFKTRLKSTKESILCSMISCEIVGTDIERSVVPLGDSTAYNDNAVDSVDSFLDEDSAFWDQALHMESEVAAISNISVPQSQFQKLLPGHIPCKHTCGNKMTCRHICCREGVPVEGKRKRRQDQEIPTTQRVPLSSASTLMNKKSRKKQLYLLDDTLVGKKSPQKPSIVDIASNNLNSDDLFDDSVFIIDEPLKQSDVSQSEPVKSNLSDNNQEAKLKTESMITIPDSSYDFENNLPSACIKIPPSSELVSPIEECLELDFDSPSQSILLPPSISNDDVIIKENQSENSDGKKDWDYSEPSWKEAAGPIIRHLKKPNDFQDEPHIELDSKEKEKEQGPETLENDDCCQLFNALFQ